MKEVLRKGKYVLLAASLLFGAAGAFLPGAGPAPLSARAAEPHTWQHDGTGEAIDLNTAISDLEFGELTAGYYYLSDDLTLSDTYLMIEQAEVELCLNGHKLDLSGGSISVYGGSLTLYDCQENGQGQITGATDSAVSVLNGGTFTMNGGKITGNSAENGGGVSVRDGTFTMNGGEISGNTANGATDTEYGFSPAGGGGVYAEHGTVEINGGTIANNQATSGYGGGILLNATQVYYGQQQSGEEAPSVAFHLSGDALIGGNTALSGGGIAMLGGVTAEMTGGVVGGKAFSDGSSVSGNTATDSSSDAAGGGGVYLMGCSLDLTDSSQEGEPTTTTVQLSPTFTMSGGTVGYEVEEGTATLPAQLGDLGNRGQYGGGVYAGENSVFTLEEKGVVGFDITKEQYEAGNADETARYPYGNLSTKDYNLGGGGVCVQDHNAQFRMTGGTVSYNNDSYNSASGIFVINDANQPPETPSSFVFSGGVVSYHPASGIYGGNYASVDVGGAALVTDNGTGFTLYPSSWSGTPSATLSGGTIANNRVGVSGTGAVLLTICGTASVTGNNIGVTNIPDIALGGTPVVKENFDENGSPKNLVVLGYNKIALAEDLSGGEIHVCLQRTGEAFTTGYRSGMEAYFFYDGLADDPADGGTIRPMETQTYEEEPAVVTELALTYRVTVQSGEQVIDELSGYYIAGEYLEDLFYTYDDNLSQLVLKPEVAELLVKAPDENFHYLFSQFSDGQGSPYDFENENYQMTQDVTVYLGFTPEAHAYPDAWTQEADVHTKTCTQCAYVTSEEHHWGEWTLDDDNTHSRTCTDNCGATQQEQHHWGAWQSDEDGNTHSRTCTDNCGATQQEQHHWSEWTSDGDNTHSRTCTDNCGATQQEQHHWGEWTSDGDNTHSRTCTDNCGATQQEQHHWSEWTSDGESTHSRTCTDNCGATQQEQHHWGEWTSDGDNTHSRTCTDNCGATQQEQHHWGAWQSDEDGYTHSRTCTDNCGATQQEQHHWGEWTSDEDGNTHSRTCTDNCGATQQEQHHWGAWQSDEDGYTHSRTCTDNCGATQQNEHDWGEWYQTDGETRTRDCPTCEARTVEADDRGKVVAAIRQDGGYVPYYRLQDAFDSAQAGETVCLVFDANGTEIGETLLIRKNVAIKNVTRTRGDDLRAVYTLTDSPVTLRRGKAQRARFFGSRRIRKFCWKTSASRGARTLRSKCTVRSPFRAGRSRANMPSASARP